MDVPEEAWRADMGAGPALIIPTATSDILGSLKHEWVFDLVSRDHRRLASRSR